MKRVLFVDDDPLLLEGLKRSMRPQRKEWDMFFAGGGEEALALMDTALRDASPIDVVVTDMRMPGMDGAALLERVHARHPDAMRIVLSGHFDVEAGIRAVPVAHQFLMKPCDPEKLRTAIERCSHPGSFPPDEATKRVVSAVGSLPSPPKICAQLLEAIGNPNASMEAIGHIIQQDVALAAKVLQLAHSAFFNLPREGTGITAALTALGINVLKQLVLSAEIMRQFRPARPIQGFSLEEFERHSQMSAQIAACLPVEASAAGLCATTALLHDAGKLILATQLPEEFEKACLTAASGDCLLHQAEEGIFGTSHAEIGAYLLNLWGLPRVAVDAIAAHHRPEVSSSRGPGLDLTAAIHIASALAHDCADQASLDQASLDQTSLDQASLDQADPDRPPARLNLDYVERLGVAAELPRWREAARQWTTPPAASSGRHS